MTLGVLAVLILDHLAYRQKEYLLSLRPLQFPGHQKVARRDGKASGSKSRGLT